MISTSSWDAFTTGITDSSFCAITDSARDRSSSCIKQGFLLTALHMVSFREPPDNRYLRISTNCDVLIDCDYADIFNSHKTQKNIVTMVCARKNMVIPYGTIQIDNQKQILSMQEKPAYLPYRTCLDFILCCSASASVMKSFWETLCITSYLYTEP